VAPDFIDSGSPGSRWGPRATQEVRWRGHNPLDLAENLRGLALVLRTGNGERGGPLGSYTDVDVVEVGVHAMGDRLHGRLQELGIPHVWDDYGPGQHLWPYWNRGLAQTLPTLMERLRRRAPPPRRITFKAIEPRYAAWGWKVSLERPVLEFSRLSGAWRGGFTLAGSGRATVTTPPAYAPGGDYTVTVRRRTQRLEADARGRLRVAVALGRANTKQQYTPGATTRVFTARVRIAP
jgi:hypothetical protein